MADVVSPVAIASGSRHSRKKTVENWDDDFDYGSIKPASTSSTRAASVVTAKSKPGRASPDSIVSSWDDSPPQTALSSHHMVTRAKTEPPALARLEGRAPHLGPPRHSPSHTAGLPHPSVLSPRNQQFDINIPPESGLSRSKTNATPAAAGRQKLIKRHPSTSFVVMAQPDRSTSSLSSAAHTNRSSPLLPRSPSSERMPPPPLPLGLERRKSRGKQKAGRPDGVRISSIPFSPSQEGIRDGERKPGFWKRFSGMPAGEKRYDVDEADGPRRRRSSSVGNKSPTKAKTHHPPVPPLPANLRSTSAASGTSDISVLSQMSGTSASSSNRSGPAAALSSILRRSTSSLSKRSDGSSRTPPSAYTPKFKNSPTRSSPIFRSPRRAAPPPPVLHTSSSFSRGFHLPSPAPGSPYSDVPPMRPLGAPLQHSASYNAALDRRSDAEADAESEEGNETTPRRRRKLRPVSALPVTRAVSRGWDAEGWGAFGETSQTALRVDTRSESRSSQHRSTASEVPAPSSPRLSGFTSNTMRRLGSISKKHGRRLSGGFKFGTTSSNSSNETDRRSSQALETVAGSPSKSSSSPVRTQRPPLPQHMPDEIFRSDVRNGSISAPSSHFQTTRAKTLGKSEISPTVAATLSGESFNAKQDKQRRRQSWADFVIPKDVLEKQKGLKEGIGAVKTFAGGVENLRSFMDVHAELYQRIQARGTGQDQFEFARLEAEFEQWWEMATVLIEVGATGATASTQPDIAAHASPARSRRITMASDEARQAADAMHRLTLGQGQPQRDPANRSASLPEPDKELRPPQSTQDQWRASTGRQDLSKRQLEVLRTMLQTPASTRPGLVRGSSTLSTSSSGSILVNARSGARTSIDRVPSGVTFPSPPDSNYVVPSASFPSPHTASTLAQPRPGLRTRRSNKGGLAGLKEFLRSLKGSSSSLAAATHRPPPVRTDLPSPTPYWPRSQLTQTSHVSPPLSPSTPSTPSFEDVPYPTNRSSFSALPPDVASPPLQRQTSPQKSGKRPNIRNLSRTSSGNWSELVRGSNSPIIGAGAVPPVPTLPRRSIDSSSEREDIPGMPSRGILRQQSQSFKSAKTPTSASFNLANKGWKSPKRRSKQSENYGAYEQGMLSRAMSRQTSRETRQETPEVDRTVRPARKSRILGLGMPTAPSSPSSPRRLQAAASGSGANDKVAMHGDRSASNTSGNSVVSGLTDLSAMSSLTGRSGASAPLGSSSTTVGTEEDLIVALTPENLPVLLDFLKQCEGKLGEWKDRAGELVVKS